MRKFKNITVCVSPEIYRQARHLAAEYDSTVSTIVAWLLERLPAALERSHFPKGGLKPSPQPASALGVSVTPPSPSPTPVPPNVACEVEAGVDTSLSDYSAIRAVKIIEKIIANSRCKTVTPPLTSDLSMVCSQSADPVTATVKL
jgi:hypothetical protein